MSKNQALEMNFGSGEPVGVRYEFVASRNFGARDHFFHFLLGYLLPSFDHAIQRNVRVASFDDCGPLLNVVLKQACALFGLTLVPSKETERFDLVTVRRWDNWLLRPDGSAAPPALVDMFRRATGPVRDHILRSVMPDLGKLLPLSEPPEIVVLQRSEPHPYYRVGGPASHPGYGRERRSLQNAKAIMQVIVDAGFRARLLDMGNLTFAEQVAAFHNARAVIGARGAEFAHLFWMRRGMDAFMFATPIEVPNHASRTLAHIQGVSFREVPVPEQHFDGPIREVEGWLSSISNPSRGGSGASPYKSCERGSV